MNVINTSCLSIRCLYCYFLVFQSYVLPITYGLPTIEDEDLALFSIYSLFPHLTIPLPLPMYNFSASTIPLIITSSFWPDKHSVFVMGMLLTDKPRLLSFSYTTFCFFPGVNCHIVHWSKLSPSVNSLFHKAKSSHQFHCPEGFSPRASLGLLLTVRSVISRSDAEP